MTKESHDKAGAPFRHLKISDAALEKLYQNIKNERKRRRENKKGGPIGRPKTRDDKAIRKLRGMGLSMRKIAQKIGCSTWTVFVSLRESAVD